MFSFAVRRSFSCLGNYHPILTLVLATQSAYTSLTLTPLTLITDILSVGYTVHHTPSQLHQRRLTVPTLTTSLWMQSTGLDYLVLQQCLFFLLALHHQQVCTCKFPLDPVLAIMFMAISMPTYALFLCVCVCVCD